MQDALFDKRRNTIGYIKFVSRFDQALTGMAFWNNNKTTKSVSKLLTITDEAFIHFLHYQL
jgi:hypothetical protein